MNDIAHNGRELVSLVLDNCSAGHGSNEFAALSCCSRLLQLIVRSFVKAVFSDMDTAVTLRKLVTPLFHRYFTAMMMWFVVDNYRFGGN
jgi:hypothetical protein